MAYCASSTIAIPIREGTRGGMDRMACSASKDKAELMQGDVVASSEGGKASKAVHDNFL